MERDLRENHLDGLPAQGMPVQPHCTLPCAERLLDTRYCLFVRLPHLSLSLDHGSDCTARSQPLNIGQVVGVQHVAVTSLNESGAPENGSLGQRAVGTQRDQRCGVSGGGRSSYKQQRLLNTRQELECRAAQAGADLTRIVFATDSDDDKVWIVPRPHRSDDVARSSESGVTLGMYVEIRLECGQHCAQRIVCAWCN